MSDDILCPICRTTAEGDWVGCPDCGQIHHVECWQYNGGCSRYGCPAAPATEKLTDLELPPSYWGSDQKACPRCGAVIQAAAVRCRACGATFETAAPQATGEFMSRQQLRSDLPRMRQQCIWLLVFSLIPCTAPGALIVGGIWYANNRQRLSALPPTQLGLAKIALIIAGALTGILVLAVVLQQLLAT